MAVRPMKLVDKYAYEADPAGSVQRGRTARADRRVGLRPAPDAMVVFTGFLPVEQGVACWAALRAHTDTVKGRGDPRTRDQIMADTLVERVTGQAAATDVQAEVALGAQPHTVATTTPTGHTYTSRAGPAPELGQVILTRAAILARCRDGSS